MAKQKGPIKIKGKVGDLSFYSSVYGDIMRQKGGASKEKIKKSPAFARLREHHEEFSHCVEAAKLMRHRLLLFTKLAPDFRLVGRMNKLMNELKNHDKKSARGKRRIMNGLSIAEGKRLFEWFDLNSQVPLEKVLKAEADIEKGILSFKNFIPKKHLKFPKDAVKAIMTFIVLRIDFEKKEGEVNHVSVELNADHKKRNIELKPKSKSQSGK